MLVLSPFRKNGMDHYSDKFEEGSFIPSLVEIDPVVF